MNRNLMSHWVPIFMAIILVASCAKVSSPSGGPKDKEPPRIIKSEPASGQTNFRGGKITITFDEFVILDKITEKFMVSPPLKKKPNINVRGKKVILEYDEVLKDSTTYTFYFQDAIRDLNESNAIDNYQFVVSTGNVVDSLSVTGNVLSSYTLDPPENTLVMLYKNPADSAFLKSIPDYITKASKTGYFRIDNIKEGIYRLYALQDNDNSKNFNLSNEAIAFMDTLIEVSSEKNYLTPLPDSLKIKTADKKNADTIVLKGDYKLILFEPEKKIRYLTGSSRSSQYKLLYALSIPPDTNDFEITIPGAGHDSYFIEKNRDRDTTLVWITDSSLYSQPQLSTIVTYPFTDSLGNTIQKQDTILMRFLVSKPAWGKAKPAPFRVTSGLEAGALKPGQKIVFTSTTPFRVPDTSRIRIYELKEKEKIPVPYRIEKDKENSCRLILHAELLQKKNYLFIADSAAFGNLYGGQTDSTGTKFIVRNDETFSKLKLNINNFEGNRLIQLLNGQEKILREVQAGKDGITEFSLLDKGKYRIRVIYDINGDGKWTTGDFLTGRQPEPVSFYPREIDLPENFWVDQPWDIGEKNVKTLKSTPKAGSKTGPGR
jgi:hypothetical protein